jgi:putative Mg2+ transporter-C (MgtC) family protein
MSLDPHWPDIALRLALTLLAAFVIGFNRGERGRTAGLRTTMLVALAAAIAMILANILLSTSGKRPDSFATLDPMRIPLGVLTGMGFIGAGAILRRNDIIVGVTTAATLWLVTLVGLSIGSGQFTLGLLAAALGFGILELLQRVERRMRQDRSAYLLLRISADGPTQSQLTELFHNAGFAPISTTLTHLVASQQRTYRYELRWHGRMNDNRPPEFLEELARKPGVLKLRWRM